MQRDRHVPAGAALDPLLDAAPCGFLSFRDDGVVDAVNTTLLDMLAMDRDEVVGRHVERLLTVGTRIFYQTHWFPLLRLHGRADEIFLMLRTGEGEECGMLVNAVRRESAGGAVYHCVLMRVRERQKYEEELLRARRAAESARAELESQHRVLEDQAGELELAGEELRTINDELLERTAELEQARAAAEEARAEAERASAAKTSFLAVMSHELRTPLNAISGYVQLLEMGVHGPVNDAQRDALDRVMRAQQHLLRLINDLLNLARIEAGHVEYEIEDVPAHVVIADVTPLVEPQMSEKRLSLVVDADPSLTVRVDREKVQQILLNLLSNAAKFTEEDGRVTVRALHSRPDMAAITVADTGVGIPPDKLELVFEPFVQVAAGGAARREGTGLGLAISRDLARGMGGNLTAASTVGEGTTFTLTLPAASI